jgi:hypothetical protein
MSASTIARRAGKTRSNDSGKLMPSRRGQESQVAACGSHSDGMRYPSAAGVCEGIWQTSNAKLKIAISSTSRHRNSGERRLPACSCRQLAGNTFAEAKPAWQAASRQAAETNRLVACAPQAACPALHSAWCCVSASEITKASFALKRVCRSRRRLRQQSRSRSSRRQCDRRGFSSSAAVPRT